MLICSGGGGDILLCRPRTLNILQSIKPWMVEPFTAFLLYGF